MLRSEHSFLLYSVDVRHIGRHQKCLENSEMRCWRRLETIDYLAPSCEKWRSITAREETNILHTIKLWKANWIGHTLRVNCFLKHVTEVKKERKIEGNKKQGRRRKQLPDEGNKQILETEIGSTRSLFLENSLWKRLWTCRKTDYVMKITHCTSLHTVAYSFRSWPLRSTSFPVHLSPIPSFDTV